MHGQRRETVAPTEYQTVLNMSTAMRTCPERTTLWQRYVDMHLAIERIMLDQHRPASHHHQR